MQRQRLARKPANDRDKLTLDDPEKHSDVLTFSVLLNHEKLTNIKEYVKSVAPHDLKNTRSVSDWFLEYVNSPVFYHFSFILNRSDNFLTKAFNVKKIRDMLEDFRQQTWFWEKNSPGTTEYWVSVRGRFSEFILDTHRRGFNQKLARKVLLTSLFASTVSFYLVAHNDASHIAWVSDRDAIVNRYDGFVCDNAFFWLALQLSETEICGAGESDKLIKVPTFLFVTPEDSGEVYCDELIRIPDYIAGTLAGYDPMEKTIGRDKHRKVLLQSLIQSPNHSIIHVLFDGDGITTRRVRFVAHER